MPIDLHYICKRGEQFKLVGDKLFETGDWILGKHLVSKVVGGRIYLHRNQKSEAWHGGTIREVIPVPDPRRAKFIYVADIPYTVLCPINWGRQRAIIHWNDDRSALETPSRLLESSLDRSDVTGIG